MVLSGPDFDEAASDCISDEFINYSLQMLVTNYDPVIETFVTYGAL